MYPAFVAVAPLMSVTVSVTGYVPCAGTSMPSWQPVSDRVSTWPLMVMRHS